MSPTLWFGDPFAFHFFTWKKKDDVNHYQERDNEASFMQFIEHFLLVFGLSWISFVLSGQIFIA